MEKEKSEAGNVDVNIDPPGEDPEDGVQPRGKWANKSEFLFSMAGQIVGLGNVVRFPYLCYVNGGAAFLIPYFVFLLFCGLPVFFLETAMGQYTGEGGVTAWRKICPMFEGIGYASQVMVMYISVYFIVMLAWAIFYLVFSFSSTLPWSTCDNYWNTGMCTTGNIHDDEFGRGSSWSFLHNTSQPEYIYEDDIGDGMMTNHNLSHPPEMEFWLHRVHGISDDIMEDGLGALNWELTLCLLAAWVICYLCLCKGIRSMGKVVYFTATFPYLMLVILFFRGITLPGAMDGIKEYLWPDLSAVLRPKAWCDAGLQVFYSYAVSQGVLTTLGSYNKYNNNCYRDCFLLCCLNACTSVFAGFTVFSVLGHMSMAMNISMSELSSSGLGLAFIAYPRALSLLPVPAFWSVLFFLMILFLGIDCQFVAVESLATTLTDMFPRQLRRKGRREHVVLVIAVVSFLLGLPFVTKGGVVAFELVDTFGPCGLSLLFIGCFESMVIGWVYGADRFMDNIEDMIGYRPFPVLKYCWLFVTPLFCIVVMMLELDDIQFMQPYNTNLGVAMTVAAFLLVAVPIMCIPVCVAVVAWRDLGQMATASSELRQARPEKPVLTLCKSVIFKAAPGATEVPMAGVGEGTEVKKHD